MRKDPIDSMDAVTFDVPDIPNWEGKLNPDVHIHYGLIHLQKMLTHEDPSIGFMQYAAQVNHIEKIAMAAKKLRNSYEQEIKDEWGQIEKQSEDAVYIKQFRLAQFKLGKILEDCFSSLPIKTFGRA